MITIIVGRAMQFLLALATLRVATTILSPAGLGQVSLILSTIAFFALFLINPIGMFINRRLHAWQETGVAKYYLIRYVNYLLLVVLIAALGMPLFYMSGVIDFGISSGWLIFLVCGSLFFNTINQTAIPSLNLLGQTKRFVLLSVATVAMSLFCAILLVIIFQPLAQYWVLGLLLGQALLALIGAKSFFVLLKKNGGADASARIQKKHLHVLFRFAWPVAIAAGLGWAQSQGYRYLVEGQLGLAELGLFVAGYGISAGIIAGFDSVLTTYFQPRLYRDVNAGSSSEQREAWQCYAAAVIPSLLLTVALIVMLAPELTQIFLGKEFQSAVEFVFWGALAEAARMLVSVYSLLAHVVMKTRWLIFPNLAGAFFALTLTALFIPDFGTVGVGMGLAMSGFIVVLLMHILLVQRVDATIPIRPILIATVSTLMLWGIVLIIRDFLLVEGWWKVGGFVAFVGVAYLVLQYLFLRPHLEKED